MNGAVTADIRKPGTVVVDSLMVFSYFPECSDLGEWRLLALPDLPQLDTTSPVPCCLVLLLCVVEALTGVMSNVMCNFFTER